MASAKPKKKNPRLASGRKRVRQDIKINAANSSLRSKYRTAVKNVEKAVAAGDKTKATELFAKMQAVVDTIADKGIFHKNPNFKEIQDFFSHTHIAHYISSAIRDHETYANIFPQLIFSKDKSKVNLLVARKARQCRWAKIDKPAGKILKCYESANWPTPSEEERKEYDVINMFDDVNDIIADENTLVYIYRAMYPLSDNDYYAEAVWNTARESGWLDIESSIPALKKYILQNQMTLKYHIEIPWDYFIRNSEQAGKNWKTMSPQEKQQMKDDFYTQMNDYLSGKENAGKTFVSYFGYDPLTKKEMPGIKITPIENPNQKGEYLDDIDQTNTQLSYALAWDRSLIGQSGKSLGAGSGSDKREAFLIATSMMRLDRDFIFEPLYFVRDYNGWDQNIQFGFPDQVLTTLDVNPTGTQKTIT